MTCVAVAGRRSGGECCVIVGGTSVRSSEYIASRTRDKAAGAAHLHESKQTSNDF